MGKTDLTQFNNAWYNTGASVFKRGLWHMVNYCFLNSALPGSFWRVYLLRLFGASIGIGVVIKPKVRIKFPWNLTVGNNTWIGESVWIDNLDKVALGSHVCISQGAMLICGNHNYKSATFDLITHPITVENGAWIGAGCTIAPGTIVAQHAVISMGSTASGTLNAFGIYKGNPAAKVAERTIN